MALSDIINTDLLLQLICLEKTVSFFLPRSMQFFFKSLVFFLQAAKLFQQLLKLIVDRVELLVQRHIIICGSPHLVLSLR